MYFIILILILYYKIKGWRHKGKLRKGFPFGVNSQMFEISRIDYPPKVVHSPSQEVFTCGSGDQTARMIQRYPVLGVLKTGNGDLWILRLTWRYSNLDILNWCECSSGVFIMLATLSHLSVKRHLKARRLCLSKGNDRYWGSWCWLFLSGCMKSAKKRLWPTFTSVFSFYSRLSLLNFLFAQVSVFIILLDCILLSFVKYFLESYELLRVFTIIFIEDEEAFTRNC